MITKILELRDRSTFIPVIAIQMSGGSEAQRWRWLLRRAGYTEFGDGSAIVLFRAAGGPATCDLYEWGDRTYRTAHEYIEKHFAEMNDGDVVDVEYILGETKEPKVSERSADPDA
jgi:hypothetical protein